MRSSRNLNKSTSSSTVFRGADTNRELRLGELDGDIPTLEAEPLIDNPYGSVVFRGADYNREMPLAEVAPNLVEMKPIPLVDDKSGSRVYRGADTRREIALEAIAPNLVPDENEDSKDLSFGEQNADTSMVFRGADTNREALLRTIADNLHWDDKQEDKYMQRVKAKALERVNLILAKAKSRAEEIIQEGKDNTADLKHEIEDRLEEAKQKCQEADNTVEDAKNTLIEAENIKANAYNEGYKEGLEQARIEAEEAKKLKSEAVGNIVLSIHGQCITIFNSWREDLTQLLYEAVEKSTNYVLDTEKKTILENLLEQSTNSLLDAREYTLRVNPQDVPTLEEIFEEKYKGQEKRWTIKADETLASGGVVVESPSGLLKNTQEERARIVDAILENLSLPLSEGDQVAYDTITQVVIDESAKADIILNSNDKEPVEAEKTEAENIENTEQVIDEPSIKAENNKDEAIMQSEAPAPEINEELADSSNSAMPIDNNQDEIVENTAIENEAPIEILKEEPIEPAKDQEIPPMLDKADRAKAPAKPKFKAQTKAEQEAAKAKAAEEMAKGKAFQEKKAMEEAAKLKEASELEEVAMDIETEAKQMVESGLNFDINEQASIMEENELDAMEMSPPFEDKMKKLGEPQEGELENTEENKSNKEEIADEILDAMGFAK